jgi:hypothetical protein
MSVAMKKLLFFLGLIPLFQVTVQAQCIADVLYLIDSPDPCHFVGMVNYDDSDCVDFFHPEWKYVWKISGAEGGDLIATYEGLAFEHVFKKFGGYDFCLEIHKDGTTLTPPTYTECVTYTTCEPCGDTQIDFEYVNCPIGGGCNLAFQTKIEAVNMVGLKPKGQYVITYHPSTPELLGGVDTLDLNFDEIDIEFHRDSSFILVSEDINVNFQRGCFVPRLELELEYGAGAHYTYGGPPCTDVLIGSDEVFRCVACNEEGFGCNASIMATEEVKKTGICEPFVCPFDIGEREAEFDTDPLLLSHDVLLISPNPVRETLHVELPSTEHDDMTIYLFDTFGKLKVEREMHGRNSTDFNVSDFTPGLYLLAVQANGKVISTEKVAVIR